MATMAALFMKTPNTSHSFPKTHKTLFIAPLKLSVSPLSNPTTRQNNRISCGLIVPDGGKLVELIVKESERDLKKREVLSLPQIKLSRIDLEWVHVLSEGWASPLKGFMREAEFLQTLHFNSLRLDDGSFVNMSLPIVLAIDDSQKFQIGESGSVALVDSVDNPIAILSKDFNLDRCSVYHPLTTVKVSGLDNEISDLFIKLRSHFDWRDRMGSPIGKLLNIEVKKFVSGCRII